MSFHGYLMCVSCSTVFSEGTWAAVIGSTLALAVALILINLILHDRKGRWSQLTVESVLGALYHSAAALLGGGPAMVDGRWWMGGGG